MGRKSFIKTYASSSDLMNVVIIYNKERFTFNLYEELEISEQKITQEAIEQPSAYAFINMLWKKLILRVEDSKIEVEKAYSSEYLRWKRKVNTETGRPYNDDYAKAKADTSELVRKAREGYSKAKNDANILEVCVKSFETRTLLIQTIAANKRAENRS